MAEAQRHLRVGLGQSKVRQGGIFLCLEPVFQEHTWLLALIQDLA